MIGVLMISGGRDHPDFTYHEWYWIVNNISSWLSVVLSGIYLGRTCRTRAYALLFIFGPMAIGITWYTIMSLAPLG